MLDDPDIRRRERLILEELETDAEAMEIYRRYAMNKVNTDEMKKLDVIYNSGNCPVFALNKMKRSG